MKNLAPRKPSAFVAACVLAACAPGSATASETSAKLGQPMKQQPPKEQAAGPSSCPASGARIYIDRAGMTTLNGRAVDPSRLREALAALSPQPTVLCYARENAAGQPPPAVGAVMEAMMAARLPIGLFTDSTFTTMLRPE